MKISEINNRIMALEVTGKDSFLFHCEAVLIWVILVEEHSIANLQLTETLREVHTQKNEGDFNLFSSY